MLRLGLSLLLAVVSLLPAIPARADRWYESEPVIGVVDAGRRANDARQAGVGWDRVLFLWQEIQPNGPDDWELERYLERANLRPTLESGIPLVAVVQGTPAWAASNPADGVAAVPRGLEFDVSDPRNSFGRFMLRMAGALKGKVSAWIIWNEPDFRPGDSGSWWTWSGTPEEFVGVLRSGYQAVKRASPAAIVVFPATSYFVDAVNGRELFLSRVLDAAAQDPQAIRDGFYFDAVGLNLYCSLDAIYQVQWRYTRALAQHSLQRPLWLTETNCPAYNDASAPLDARFRISTDEQAAFLVQSIALARGAGYQRIGWYGMVDHDPRSGIEDRWGLLRPDGTARPAFSALKVATSYLSGDGQVARFAPLGGVDRFGGWNIWRVVLDEPGSRRRVQVLWRGFNGPAEIRLLAASGATGSLVDVFGRSTLAGQVGGWWEVPLPPPRRPQGSDPPGFHSVGAPVLLVEEHVSPAYPFGNPELRF